MNTINGTQIAQKIFSELKDEVATLGFKPLFCDLLIGNDAVSRSYVNIKRRRAEEIGLEFKLAELPVTTTTEKVIQEIESIQTNSHLAGLIVQLPLPANLDKLAILNAINPKLDVDCLGSTNTKLFYADQAKLIPPTASAILALLDSLKLNLSQSKILVVGQGDLVGRPVAFLLRARHFNVKTADSSTLDLKELTRLADIIISGTGQANLITGEMIKTGAILIDCGTTESNGGIVGDVDLESVSANAGLVAPVPGGVGPITIASLLYNVVEVAKNLKLN